MKILMTGLVMALVAGSSALAQTTGGPAERCAAETNAGRFAEAKMACDQAVAGKPGDADMLGLRARSAFAQGQFDAAIHDLDAAVELNPRSDSLMFLRAMAYQRKGNAAAALLDFQTALLIAPQNLEYLVAAGNLTRAMNQNDKAIGYFDRALAVNAGSIPALMGKGHALRGKSDITGALAAFDTATRAAPGDAQPLHWRGHMNAQKGDYVKAEADFAAALVISPKSADMLSDRGDSLTALKRETEALASYTLAVETDPSYVRGVRSRGVARYRVKDYLGAQLDLEQAQKQAPDPGTADNLRVIKTTLALAYKTPLTDARTALRRADKAGASCEGSLPSSYRYASALADAAGDVAKAEQSLNASTLTSYRGCLQSAHTASSSAEEDLPALRLKLVGLLEQQAKVSEELRARCDALPPAKTICDGLLAEIAAETAQLRADQRRIETAALAQGGTIAQMEAAAPTRVSDSISAARGQFAANAAKSYGSSMDFAGLQEAVNLVNGSPPRNLYSACGNIQLRAPKAGELDSMNSMLNRHRDCLNGLKRESGNSSYRYSSANLKIGDSIRTNDTYRQFRCSARPGAGCVDDAVWTRAAGLATPALRDRALSASRTAGQLPDQVDTELARLNDAVGRINSEVKRNNTAQGLANALSAFADAFNAAAPANTYGGGYGTSTVLPGIR